MHRTLLISEILTDILQRLDNASLVKVATVCRAWSEVALDILYHTIERDQWTHEAFAQHALVKNAFRIREIHCGLYDDIRPFHRGLVQPASLGAANNSFVEPKEEIGDDVQAPPRSRVFGIPTMNQLRVLECPSISIDNAPLIVDILRLNPGVEKLVLPLAEMVSPSFRKTRPTMDAFLQQHPGDDPLPLPPGYTSEAQEILATLFCLVTTKLPALRELTLRDWRLAEGDIQRLLTSPTLQQSLEALDLDETHDGWYRWQPQQLPSDKRVRRRMRQYRDGLVALPQERVAAVVNPEEIPRERKPWNKLRSLRINGFPQGSLTLFKVTRWCPYLRTLVLAADSREASLFPGYSPTSFEASPEMSDDDEEEGGYGNEDDQGADDAGAGEVSTATHRQHMLVSLAMFRNTLRTHCPNVVELKLEQIAIPHPKTFRCLLEALSPAPGPSDKTIGAAPQRRGLRRFEADGNVVLPINMVQYLVELAAPTLETVVLGRRIMFFQDGSWVRYARVSGLGTILNLLRSCSALTHVEVECRPLRIDASEMLGLRHDVDQEGIQGSHHTPGPESMGSQENGVQSSSSSPLKEWACHDTLRTLKCNIEVTVPNEETRYVDLDGISSLMTGKKIHNRVLLFLNSMPLLQYYLEGEVDDLEVE
ncbi:hypothetical protein DFQ26_009561 [Actinomortierella ambigua]|nr:hypothetical protein DFQ26_009561 [Actinomortierella ambigua]